jgi:hypothetical protein
MGIINLKKEKGISRHMEIVVCKNLRTKTKTNPQKQS